jgi:predicted enzyme related to lactoylglutathione lyase
MSIQVKEIAFVFCPVTDVAKARHFYEKLLGLKLGLEFEFAPGQWWIEYDVAGVALAISNAMPGQKNDGLMLEVADLDAALAAVQAAGLKPAKEIMEFAPCRMFTVNDPDGNEIGLHQRKAKA